MEKEEEMREEELIAMFRFLLSFFVSTSPTTASYSEYLERRIWFHVCSAVMGQRQITYTIHHRIEFTPFWDL